MSGEAPEQTAGPEFEQTARRLWEREYDYGPPQLDDHPEAVFSRYAEAVRTLLADHGFVQPFQLQADSKQQDQWTTYVEYLAFECYWLEELDVVAQKLQRKPSRARKYQIAEAEVGHQQRRVEWVRSEISKIEAEQKVAGKSGGSSSGRSRKRKSTDDVDGVQPRVAKRRRMDETEEKVAGRSDNSRTTRSKKRKLSGDEDAAEPKLKTQSKKRKLSADEDAPEPKLKTEEVAGESDGAGTRRRKRRKGTHEKNGSAALGSVLQSGLEAAAVSAVTTPSQPRQERLNTLRPRADGKVASVRGLKT